MPFRRTIRRTINLRNARIIIGENKMSIESDKTPNYAKWVRITTNVSEKTVKG